MYLQTCKMYGCALGNDKDTRKHSILAVRFGLIDYESSSSGAIISPKPISGTRIDADV